MNIRSRKRLRILIYVLAIVCISGAAVLYVCSVNRVSLGGWAYLVVYGSVVTGFATAACSLWYRDTVRKSRLLDDPHRCRVCGYDLTGNVSGICPECGTECMKK